MHVMTRFGRNIIQPHSPWTNVFFTIALALCVMAILRPAWADTPPIPEKKSEQLNVIEKSIGVKKAEKEKLEKQAEDAEKDMKKTKGRLIAAAHDIKKSEQILQKLEADIHDKEQAREILADEFEHDRKDLAKLLMALQKMSRVPPEALIAKPDTPYKTAQTALLMRNIIPSIKAQADGLSEKLRSLDELTQGLKEKHEAAREKTAELEQQYVSLKALMKKRETFYANTQKDLEQSNKELQRMARQAKDLRALMAKLKMRQTNERTSGSQTVLTPMPGLGKSQLPVAGTLVTRFAQQDEFGAPSQGIKIRGRPDGIVVAPMGGVIRFAGGFKNYGNMIILEHDKGFHSLIGGLGTMNVSVGQSLSAGEPLGRLHNEKPLLYYELRKDGSPVNPSTKFKGL